VTYNGKGDTWMLSLPRLERAVRQDNPNLSAPIENLKSVRALAARRVKTSAPYRWCAKPAGRVLRIYGRYEETPLISNIPTDAIHPAAYTSHREPNNPHFWNAPSRRASCFPVRREPALFQ
jgi:hypothetical protein